MHTRGSSFARTSRIIPPPTPVITPRKAGRNIPWWTAIPAFTPSIVKAARPRVSKINNNWVVKDSILFLVVFLWKYNIKIVKLAVTSAIITKIGFLNITGGVTPISTSLTIPPPTAVHSARILIPNKSIFFLLATITPEIAKAIVPTISMIKLNVAFIYTPIKKQP